MIDAHQHFWKFDPIRDAWITSEMEVLKRDFFPEDLSPLLRSHGIEGTVAVQADQSAEETAFLLDLASSHPIIKGVVGWIDLRSKELLRNLEPLQNEKALKGFRHIVQAEPTGFLRQDSFIDGVKKISAHGYTYDLLIYHTQLDDALYFVSKLPDVKIVLDHIGKPSIRTKEKTRWELALSALSTFSNVHCKISGLVTEADWKQWTKDDIYPFLDEVMESFGPSRVMYGSDWPVCLLAADYERQFSLVTEYISTLSADEQHAIMDLNARRFYNL